MPLETFQVREVTSPGKRKAEQLVQTVSPDSIANWNNLLQTHSECSFFHTAEWAKVLEETYPGYEPIYFVAHDAGGLHALLPVMKVDSRLTGCRGISLPFTDECRPLFWEASSGHRLVRSAVSFGRLKRWKSVEFRGGKELFPDAPVAISYYGHRLNLDKDKDEVFACFDGSSRRAIRKAEKNGVTVTVSRQMDAIKQFYSLHCQTRRRHGLPPQPFAFFSNIGRHILTRGLGTVVVARWKNRPIAAAVYFQLGSRAVYKFGASDKSCQQLRAANLVMWEGIKSLLSNGIKSLDFGRTCLHNEGLRRFKLNWGAQEYKIEYTKYDFRRNAFVTGADAASGWHNWIFRALPTRISRLIGTVLYRHMA